MESRKEDEVVNKNCKCYLALAKALWGRHDYSFTQTVYFMV